MRGRLFLLSLMFVLAAIAAGAAPAPQAAPASHIVLFREGVDPDAASADLARAHGLTREFVYRFAVRGASFVIPPGREGSVRSDPRVASVEANQRVFAFAQTTPTGVNRIDAEGVTGSVNVDAAIIDTGIDLTHPDLNVVGSTDCARGGPFNRSCQDGAGNDGNGHGSHVAGIVAARDDSVGVRGVAPGARLWAVRVLDNSGNGYVSWIVAGIDWVTARKDTIEVANMSLGFEGSSTALDTAITNSVKAGITYVVAAGNYSKDASTFSPANHPDVIAVSAIVDTDGLCGGSGGGTGYGDDDSFASFSNYGSLVDLAAPGVNIYSTYKSGGYATMSGTSMASPHVAGAAAVYKATHPTASPSDVKGALRGNGITQNAQCTAGSGNGYFTGDSDGFAEPLVYVPGLSDGGTPPDTTPPAAPTGLKASAGNASVALDWNDNAENDLAGYNVYRGTASGGPYGTKVNGASLVTDSNYTDATATNGDTYYYVVTAVDGNGNESDYSNAAPATPTAGSSNVGVASVSYSVEGGKGKKSYLRIVVLLEDDGGTPVANASIAATATNSTGPSKNFAGTTGTDGRVAFKWTNAPNGTYTTTVTSATVGGVTWEVDTVPNSFEKK